MVGDSEGSPLPALVVAEAPGSPRLMVGDLASITRTVRRLSPAGRFRFGRGGVEAGGRRGAALEASKEPCAEDSERRRPVLLLRSLRLATDRDAARSVRDLDGALRLVPVLAASARSAACSDVEVSLVDLDFALGRFRENGDRHRRGLDPAALVIRGTRIQRWPPASSRNTWAAFGPMTRKATKPEAI